MPTATMVAVGLLVTVAIFQLALALGAPFGKAACPRQRLATALAGRECFVGLLVYPAVISVVLSAAGVIDTDLVPGRGAATMWVLAGIFLLGAMADAVSRSGVERWWAAPVSLAIAICCALLGADL